MMFGHTNLLFELCFGRTSASKRFASWAGWTGYDLLRTLVAPERLGLVLQTNE